MPFQRQTPPAAPTAVLVAERPLPPEPDPAPPEPEPEPAPPIEVVRDGALTLAQHAPLDAAARLLLAQLDKQVAAFAEEAAHLHMQLPVWAVVLGAVQRAYEDATLIAPILAPMVRRACEGYIPPQRRAAFHCEQCGMTFTPVRWGQRFCSQVCGAAAQRLRDHPLAANGKQQDTAA